jgi:ferredoxin
VPAEVTGCTACGVCVRACSTGALSLQQDDSGSGLFALEHMVSRCDDCGRCVALCPTRALVRTGQGDWARILDDKSRTLATGAVRRCGRCGVSFADTDAGLYCPPCAFRLANPFGSRVPAAATT